MSAGATVDGTPTKVLPTSPPVTEENKPKIDTGTKIDLHISSVYDPSWKDRNAGYTYQWDVTLNGHKLKLPSSIETDLETFSYTPDVKGDYVINLYVRDEDELSDANLQPTVTMPFHVGTTMALGATPPPTPTDVAAGYAGQGRVGLRWKEDFSEDEGLLDFDIYRSTNPDFVPTPATLIGSQDFSRDGYTDDQVPNGASQGKTFYYRVVAVAQTGDGTEVNSHPSAAVAVVTTSRRMRRSRQVILQRRHPSIA